MKFTSLACTHMFSLHGMAEMRANMRMHILSTFQWHSMSCKALSLLAQLIPVCCVVISAAGAWRRSRQEPGA